MSDTSLYRDAVQPDGLRLTTDVIDFRFRCTRRMTQISRCYAADGPGQIDTIAFIHGLGGSRDDYPMLAGDWARYGYLVLRPDMLDSPYCEGPDAKDQWEDRMRETVELAERVTELLPEGLTLGAFGLGGHSDGARSVLGALGLGLRTGKRYTTQAARAGLLLSPPGRDNTMSESPFEGIVAPIYSITGSRDVGEVEDEIQPATWRTECAHTVRDTTSVLSVYQDGDHGHGFPFGDNGRTDADQQLVVRDQCLAWWDWWLRGSETAAMWTASGLWERNGAPFDEYYCNGVHT